MRIEETCLGQIRGRGLVGFCNPIFSLLFILFFESNRDVMIIR